MLTQKEAKVKFWQNFQNSIRDIGDRSFFMREGGLVGLGGGALEKIGLKGGASRKKMKERGGLDEKIRLKIG